MNVADCLLIGENDGGEGMGPEYRPEGALYVFDPFNMTRTIGRLSCSHWTGPPTHSGWPATRSRSRIEETFVFGSRILFSVSAYNLTMYSNHYNENKSLAIAVVDRKKG